MVKRLFLLVAKGGIEPPTQGFSVLCSTDWATWPFEKRLDKKRIGSFIEL